MPTSLWTDNIIGRFSNTLANVGIWPREFLSCSRKDGFAPGPRGLGKNGFANAALLFSQFTWLVPPRIAIASWTPEKGRALLDASFPDPFLQGFPARCQKKKPGHHDGRSPDRGQGDEPGQVDGNGKVNAETEEKGADDEEPGAPHESSQLGKFSSGRRGNPHCADHQGKLLVVADCGHQGTETLVRDLFPQGMFRVGPEGKRKKPSAAPHARIIMPSNQLSPLGLVEPGKIHSFFDSPKRPGSEAIHG